MVLVALLFVVIQAQATLFWARPYDPHLQRWIQRDPIGEEGGLNLYAYVANNPINLWDPFGLKDWSAQETWDLLMEVRSRAQNGGMSWAWNQYPLTPWQHPDPDLRLDFKAQSPNDTFVVHDKCYKADEFGNFLAGFAGENAGGYFGLWGEEAGGIAFDAVDPSRKSNWNPFSLDADSRPDIRAGFNFASSVNNTVYSLSQQGYSGYQYSVNTISITLSPQQILNTMRP